MINSSLYIEKVLMESQDYNNDIEEYEGPIEDIDWCDEV